jgi:hypothetical protein
MSTLRISTKDHNRAISLKNYLSQHGLQVVMLSPTELEIEDGNVSAELGDEISSWQHSHDLEITVHPVSNNTTGSEEYLQQNEEWSDSAVPQREFVLAPHWRIAKAQAARLGSALGAIGSGLAIKGQAMRGAFRRSSSWLHEKEERILARSTASDGERKIAEEQAWTKRVEPRENVPPVENVRRVEEAQPERIPLRQRIQPAIASIATLKSTRWLTDGGKAVAFAGGIVMAGLIGIGLSVSHIDKASAGTSHAASDPTAATVVRTSAPAVQSPSVATTAPQVARVAKPSPVVTPKTAAKHVASAKPLVRHHEEDVAENDSPEVVTHYYHQKAVSQMRKPAPDGIKHYSDLD